MVKLFNIGDLTPGKKNHEPQEDKSAILAESFLQVHNLKLESIKDLLGRLPNESEIFFIWTLKSFNAFTFIPYLIKHAGVIDEMIITSYSINKRIVNALMKLVDSGKIKKVSLFLSSTMKFRMPAVVDLLESLLAHRPELQIHYEWSHAKIALCRIGNDSYVVEGSGNWGENARHEQYIFLKSESVFEFRRNWIENEIHRGTN